MKISLALCRSRRVGKLLDIWKRNGREAAKRCFLFGKSRFDIFPLKNCELWLQHVAVAVDVLVMCATAMSQLGGRLDHNCGAETYTAALSSLRLHHEEKDADCADSEREQQKVFQSNCGTKRLAPSQT